VAAVTFTSRYSKQSLRGTLSQSPDYVPNGDRAFLMKGGVFSDDFIDSYIELKMSEVYAFEHTPHPVEFKMYYSV
jgi:glutamine synthetase